MDGAQDQIAQLRAAIAAQESIRPVVGDQAADLTIGLLREKLAALESQPRELAPERKLVTVLFADLAGFTPLAERLDPEEVRDVMDAYFAALTPAIARYGGRVEKFIGDAVLAVFGLPTTGEDDPANAVRAALAMQRNLAVLNADLYPQRGIQLWMRVGLNTGLVLASLLGGHREEHYTVIGDTVNLASRLQSAAPPGEVLIGQATYDQVRGLFDVQPQPALAVKGKAEPVQTYLVYREKARAFFMPTRGVAGISTRTIGREAELDEMRAAYREAAAGQGQRWLTISGEAGVGKSRLMTEFQHWLELRPEAIWYLRGRAWPHSRHIPYFLLRDLLSFRFQILDGDSLDVARGKLEAGLVGAMGSGLGEEAAAFLGQLAGFDYSHSRWIAPILSDRRQIRGRAEVLLRTYLQLLRASQPLALLLEDLHWADDDSLSLLAAVLEGGEAAPPLCVVGLARPDFWERQVPWGGREHRRLDLRPLAQEQAVELGRELLQRVEPPHDWLLAVLIERGGGNPYFTEELLHWLIEQKVIDVSAEMWRVHEQRMAGMRVPETVQAVLQARMDRLAPEEQATLQAAAVMGRAFWDGAVERIGGLAVPPARWLALQQHDLIVRQPASRLPDQVEYQFKHVLLRDTVYEHTLVKVRRQYHRRAAGWLAGVAAERADEWAQVVADHYEQAGDAALAGGWHARAGRHARATFAPAAAIGHYDRALALLGSGGQEVPAQQLVEIYAGLGQMLHWQAHYARSLEAYRHMLDAAVTVRDMAAQGRAWNEMSRLLDKQGDPEAAIEASLRAQASAELAGPGARDTLVQALYNRGFAHFRRGDLAQAQALGEEAVDIAIDLGDDGRRELANSLNLLGGVHDMLGHFARAADYQRQALLIQRRLGNRLGVEIMLNNLGENARLQGDYEAAVPLFEEALAIAREIGDRDGVPMYLAGLGGALAGRGDHTAAEPLLRQALDMSQAAGHHLARAYSLLFLAETLLGLERLAQALALAREAQAAGQAGGLPDVVGEAWRVVGSAAARGAAEALDPRTCFEQSATILAGVGMTAEQARSLRAWAAYEMEQGDPVRSQALYQQARDLFARLDMQLELERTREMEKTPDCARSTSGTTNKALQ